VVQVGQILSSFAPETSEVASVFVQIALASEDAILDLLTFETIAIGRKEDALDLL
jgi:hypothetical protein